MTKLPKATMTDTRSGRCIAAPAEAVVVDEGIELEVADVDWVLEGGVVTPL